MFINELTNKLEVQRNIYEQYQILIQNKKNIIKVISNSKIKEKNDYDFYLKLGKYLAYMFYNKRVNIFIEKEERRKNEDDIDDRLKIFYDGKENRKNIELINGEKFYIFMHPLLLISILTQHIHELCNF